MQTFYDAIGGEPTFRRIVQRFYAEVATDEILRPLYPEADLSGAEERLRLFLMQRWGGPTTYSDTRGHPRLRMRHAPFVVGEPERDAWLRHMNAALDALVTERGVDPQIEARILEYFARAADAMVNTR